MSTVPTSPQPSGIFSEPPVERMFPWAAVGTATLAVLILLGVLLMLGHKRAAATNTVQPLASYASSLAITDLHMIESTSVGNTKQTYIDGSIANNGSQTVTGLIVRTLFANDEKMAPQIETGPLMLIRTREPYVDTEMVSAEPLTPGTKREFRLTFESIGSNWNQTLPEVHVTSVATR